MNNQAKNYWSPIAHNFCQNEITMSISLGYCIQIVL